MIHACLLAPVSDDPSKRDSDGPFPHCHDQCVLVRLGFSPEDRAELAAASTRPEARAEIEQAIARRALADRLTSATVLAAGVAHELNNPLAYVTANLSFLAERTSRIAELLSGAPRTPDDADLITQLVEATREARTGADRMRTIVRDLRTFARADDPTPRPVDVRPVLDSCLNVAWSELRRRAEVVRDLAPVPAVLGDEARLSQVFLNLLLNAAQSIPGGRAETHQIRVSTRNLPDGRVAVEVRDTGEGIAPEHLRRIFDPFFTTRDPGRATGLGLSICHAVVTSLGGLIEVESTPGKGSAFRVLLPPLPREEAKKAGFPTPPPAPRRLRVLVVDDEPLVGTVVRRTLSEHEVTAVQSAKAALDRLASGEAYDVVLSDLLMPGTSGMELYDAVAARYPELARRFVFLTGGAFTPTARAFLEREGVEWIEKPFDAAALREVVARRAEPQG
jgi:signal transduction histidine kinase/CheY-like chemotaxis protein